MKHSLHMILSASLLMVILLVTAAAGQQRQYDTVVYGNDQFLKSDQVVTGFKGPKAVVQFETVNPFSAAFVYFGTALPGQKMGAVYYRKTAKERHDGDEVFFTRHTVKIDVSKLENILYDSVGLIEKGGGTIYCRLEAYDSKFGVSRFHDFNFRYRRQGPPKTGVYSLACALVEGPIVDCVTPDSLVISWRTDQVSPGAVVIDGYRTFSSAPARKHEVTISGLKPDTRYSYRVVYAGNRAYAGYRVHYGDRGETQKFSFRTAPLPGSREPFSFGFMSDGRIGVGGGENAIYGVNFKVVAHYANELSNHGVRFIVFGGDLVNGYTSEWYNFDRQLITWKKAVGTVGAQLPIYEVAGNHEMIADFYQYPDPESPGDVFLAAVDRRGDDSTEAFFARHFVNPKGSVYGFAAEPEDKHKGVGGPSRGPAYDENVYSFKYGNIHFTALNTNYWPTMIKDGPGTTGIFADREQNALALSAFGGNREGYVMDNQIEWLKKDLAAAQADDTVDWIFVTFHEPPFPNGGHLCDVMFWGDNGHGERGGLNDPSVPCGDVLDMRDRVMETICAHSKVVAVMCGDEHSYSRTLVDQRLNARYRSPVWQIISGGVGAPYYAQDKSAPWYDHVECFTAARNYCLVTVDGKKLGLYVFAEDGQIIEHVKDLTAIKR